MLNLQRKYINVHDDARIQPRIEFHYPVTIIGLDVEARIVDFSLSGFYIETPSMNMISAQKKMNLALKLPGENSSVTIKAEVVRQDGDGFGCRFVDLSPDAQWALSRFFDMFSAMLPIE